MQHGIKFTYMAEIGVPSITKANEQVADEPIVDQANCNQVCVLKQRMWHQNGTMYSPPLPANSTYHSRYLSVHQCQDPTYSAVGVLQLAGQIGSLKEHTLVLGERTVGVMLW